MNVTLPASLQREELASVQLDKALTLPACMYADPAFHDLDAEVIFSHSWQLVGHGNALASAGDHVVADIGGKPVIAVRGSDNVLRAFFNVCRHRAGPLAISNGNARQLQCKYHGWTYTLEGQLRTAHEMQDAMDFDKQCIHLEQLAAASWQNQVFVSLEKQPAVHLDVLLAGISEQIAPVVLADMRFHTCITYEVACNWKVYVDNYLEGYHLPHVHPGLNRLLDYRAYHTNTAAWYSYQHSPLDGTQGPYQSGQAHYYFIYPNLMLNILPGRLQINRVIPVSQDHCQVVFEYYYTDTESPAAQKMIADDLRFSDEVQREDIGICERVQCGLASGAYKAGRLSPKREAGVHHFQELIRKAYRQALA